MNLKLKKYLITGALSIFLSYSVLYWEFIGVEDFLINLKHLFVFSIIFFPIALGLIYIYVYFLGISKEKVYKSLSHLSILTILLLISHFFYKPRVGFAISPVSTLSDIIQNSLTTPILFWIVFTLFIFLFLKISKNKITHFLKKFFILLGINLLTLFFCYMLYWVFGVIYMLANFG